MINAMQCGQFFLQKWDDSPQIAEISLPDVEIYPPRPLFRNFTNSVVKLDLIFTHPIDHHQISSISYPYQCLFAPSAQKGMGLEKICRSFHMETVTGL